MKELWGDLSEAEQKATKDLGFDAEIWEEGGTPSRCWLPFSELKDFEQKAANLLGCASGLSDTGRLTRTRSPTASHSSHPPLLPLCRYTQQIWDDENSFLESTENLMDEIADEGIDKLIAEIAKEAHEECQRPPSPPHPSGLAAKDRNWADMKEKERHAAESLGFTADGWDGGDTPYAFTLPWRRISMRAKAAAQYLGYKPEGWDKEAYNTAQARLVIAKAETAAMLRHDGTPPPGKEGAGPKDGKDKDLWDELFPEERQAARVLGYTQEAWDEGEAPQYCKVKWDELTPQLRAAAYALGYTTSVCWDWEVGQTLWYEGIEEQGPLRNPKPIRSAALQDEDKPPLVHPRCTTKREDGQMRRIDEPLCEPPEEEPRSQEGAAKEKAAALFDAAVAKEKAAAAAGPSKEVKLVSAAKAAWAAGQGTLAQAVAIEKAAAAAGPSKATGLRDLRLAASSVPTLDEAVALLLKNGPAQFYDAHETLNKILDNVTANPGEDKYRRLKRSNPVLNMKVFSAKGSERFLQCVGFVEQRDEKDGTVFVLRAEGVKGTLSHFQKTRLAAGKDALKTAKASKATFHPRDLER